MLVALPYDRNSFVTPPFLRSVAGLLVADVRQVDIEAEARASALGARCDSLAAFWINVLKQRVKRHAMSAVAEC
jgi:hypothetical protein